jgi:uncharacterized protein with HEPN domain
MREAIERIQSYTSGMAREELESDQRTLDAVVWNLTVLGEAARQVPDDVTDANPEIPWPQIRGTRNRIVHGYDRIDFGIVWEVIQQELAPLIPILDRILNASNR